MKSFFSAIFGQDVKSTLIGIGLGALQATSGHGLKNWAIALGLGLLGRVTNELGNKFGPKQ